MRITLEIAMKAANAVLKEMKKDSKEGVIAIADSHGELLFFLRTDHAPLSSIQIAQNKAYTAARERKDSVELGNTIRDVAKKYDISYWGDVRFTGFGGGVVVKFQDEVVGAIAVSGLPSAEDIYYAKLGLSTIEKELFHLG